MKVIATPPEGAITTEAQIQELITRANKGEQVLLFQVHGLGSGSYCTDHEIQLGAELVMEDKAPDTLAPPLDPTVKQTGRITQVRDVKLNYVSDLSLLDGNVPANSYNDHYLFTDRLRAQAYFIRAKTETLDIEPDPYDFASDYDDGRYVEIEEDPGDWGSHRREDDYDDRDLEPPPKPMTDKERRRVEAANRRWLENDAAGKTNLGVILAEALRRKAAGG